MTWWIDDLADLVPDSAGETEDGIYYLPPQFPFPKRLFPGIAPQNTLGGVGLVGVDGSTTHTFTLSGKFAIIPTPLKDENGNNLGNLSGLKWLWSDTLPDAWAQTLPSQIVKGGETTGTTDTNAKFSVNVVAYTALGLGQTGYLIVTNSTGSPTQSPSWRGWQGPVTLSATA